MQFVAVVLQNFVYLQSKEFFLYPCTTGSCVVHAINKGSFQRFPGLEFLGHLAPKLEYWRQKG